MKNRAFRYSHPSHLLKADGLGSELQIVVRLFSLDAVLVFDRIDRAVAPELNHVALPNEPETIRPDRQ